MPAHVYVTLTLPAEPSQAADAQLILSAAIALRNRFERVPGLKNAREAVVLLDRAVMVAMGGFHVHPR